MDIITIYGHITLDSTPTQVIEEYELQFLEMMEALEKMKDKLNQHIADAAEKATKEASRQANMARKAAEEAANIASGTAMGAANIAGAAAVGAVGAAGGAMGMVSDKEAPLKRSQIQETSESLFVRYDLDGSGSINSHDELEQLTYNLAFKLKLQISTKDMDAILGGVSGLEAAGGAWDMAQFQAWFTKEVVLFHDIEISED